MATYRRRRSLWQAQIRRQGNRPISKSFKTRADAEAWARAIEAEIDRAALPPNYAQLKTIRLEQLIGRYLEQISPKKKSHYKERCQLMRLKRAPMASLPLDKVTPALFAKFRDERLLEAGPQAVRHDLNVLGHMFKIAIREWGIALPSNPLDFISKPKIPRSRERRLSHGELERLERFAEERWGKHTRDFIRMAVETGMRKSELLAMKWQNVDFERKTLLIPETKNGYSRRIPLSPKAMEILSAYRFSNQDAVWPLTDSWLRYVWQRVTTKAASDDLHFRPWRCFALTHLRYGKRSIACSNVSKSIVASDLTAPNSHPRPSMI